MTALDERRGWLRRAFTLLKALPSDSAEWTAQRDAIDAKLAEWQRDTPAGDRVGGTPLTPSSLNGSMMRQETEGDGKAASL